MIQWEGALLAVGKVLESRLAAGELVFAEDEGEARARATGGPHLRAEGALPVRSGHGQAGLPHGDGQLGGLIASAVSSCDNEHVRRRELHGFRVGLFVVENDALNPGAEADAGGEWAAELFG